MSPKPSHARDLSDTGKELLAVLEAEVDRIRQERAAVQASHPSTSDSSEYLRAIAGEVAENRVTSHKLHCLMPGGVLHTVAKKWEDEMEDIKKTQKSHDDFISQYLGEQKFKRFVMPILIGFIGSSAGVALMMLLLRTVIARAIAGGLTP